MAVANIYDQVVKITHVYLGPAAERFIDRQIQSHLHKDPASITPKDLSELIIWIRSAMSLLTDNLGVIEEYIERLKKLTVEPEKNK